jgi:hypothetical protein
MPAVVVAAVTQDTALNLQQVVREAVELEQM